MNEEKILLIEKYETPEIHEIKLETHSSVSNGGDEASACHNSCCFSRDDGSWAW